MAFPTTGALTAGTWSGAANAAVPAGGTSPALQDAGTVVQAGSGLAKASAIASWGWATSSGPDQEVWFPLSTLPAAGDYVQLFLRASNLGAVNPSVYILKVTFPTPNTNAATWDVRKKITGGGSTSVSVVSTTTAMAAGDSIGFEVIGSTLKAYKKPAAGAWAQVGTSASDSAITAAGFLGFTISDTTMRVGTVGGGSIATTVTSTLTATQAQVASQVLQAQAVRAATQGQAATRTPVVNAIRAATQTQVAAKIARPSIVRSAGQGQAASIAMTRVVLLTLAATQGQAGSVTRRPACIRVAGQAQAGARGIQTARTLSATQAQAASAASHVNPAPVTLHLLAILGAGA